MDKALLLETIAAHFEKEWKLTVQAAKNIYEAATHPDAKAENKYDTRGLEASYMAGSQAKRALGLQQTVNIYRSMLPRDFSDEDAIAPGALVTMEDGEGNRRNYFLGPKGGGAKIPFQGMSITIITSASPIGQKLTVCELGDELSVGEGRDIKNWEIIAIC